MDLTSALLAIVLIILCIYSTWRRRHIYQLSWNIPGPFALPFLGSIHIFLGKYSKIVSCLNNLFNLYPDVGKLWIGNQLYILVSKPEFMEIVLNNSEAREKIDYYKFLKPSIGNGLISGPAKIWKVHRKIIAPAFTQIVLNKFPGAISEQCNILVGKLQKEVGKGPVEISKHIAKSSIDIIGETIFGVSLNDFTISDKYCTFEGILKIAFERMLNYCYKPNCIFVWTKLYQEQEELLSRMAKLRNFIIEEKYRQIQEQTLEKKDCVDLIMNKYLKKEFSRAELEDEVNTFLLAGSDSNTAAISSTLLLLGMHQDIQEKVYNEAMEILGPDRPVDLEDLQKLEYTERVIKEALRIFPGAPMLGRHTTADISIGKFTIPKGCNLLLGILALHRDPKYWPDPFKFDPDRFLPENSRGRNSYCWLPFSGGTRNCIGSKFSMMVMKIMIAMVIRKVKIISPIKHVEDIELISNFVLKAKNGYIFTFEHR